MKIIILILIMILILGCSTMPEDYQSTEQELIHMEYGIFWSVIMTGLTAYTYYYLDEKAEWF